VAQALDNRNWVHDIKGALTVQVLVEYLHIWNMVEGVVLRQDVVDQYKWKLTQHGLYSSKSAYEAFFLGSIKFGPWRKIWKTWARPRCKFFIWLVLLGHAWTVDRLAKRNLPHPEACPLCDQEVETINHLLVGCAFVREVWTITLQHFGLIQLAPQPAAARFLGWWRQAILAAPKEVRKGLNSLMILVAWELWKHRNACVFEKQRPGIQIVLSSVSLEGDLWCLAEASKLKELVFRSSALLA
jgi:hypothetical protein